MAAIVVIGAFSLTRTDLAVACTPGRPNDSSVYQAGTQKTPTNWPRATKAKIEAYLPYVFTNSYVTEWVMLRGAPQPQKWAQVGHMVHKDASGIVTRSVFVQWTDATGHVFIHSDYAAAGLGTKPEFQVIYDVFNKDWLFEENGSVLFTTDALWQPTTAVAYGETLTRASQMPGGDSNRVDFQEAQYLPNNSGTWVDFAMPPFATDPTIHQAFRLSNQFYQIQDLACGS